MMHKDPETTSCSNFSEIVETSEARINNDCFDDDSGWGWPSREATPAPAPKNHERPPSTEFDYAVSTASLRTVPAVEKNLNLLPDKKSNCSFESYVKERGKGELPRSSPITVGGYE
jgi:hypothetical protein